MEDRVGKVKIMQKKALIGRNTTERSEGEPYVPALRCVCGHLQEDHAKNETRESSFPKKGDSFCWECVRQGTYALDKVWHDFKLDNLSLIEQTAYERGLI